MQQKYKQRLTHTGVSILIASVVFACTLLSPAHEPVISSNEAYYTIDSNSILESIHNTDTDTFVFVDRLPETSPSNPISVRWRQTDYFDIVSALFKNEWKEDIENWNLHIMFFRLDCQDVDVGIQFASLEYYKLIDEGDRETRLRRAIHIDPSINSISVFETEYYPTSMLWHSVNLEKLKISAQDALQISESNGGRESRLSVDNNCFITETLAPDALYEGWSVVYSQYGGNTSDLERELINFNIDVLTGKYEITHPKTK